MRVYFEETYWGCLEEKAGEEPGKEIRTETEFVWEGRTWLIPAVYLCRQGLVMDVCGRVERREVTEFYEKWSEQEEEWSCSLESPFCQNFRIEARVNETHVQTRMGCGSSYCPSELIPEERDEAVSVTSEKIEEQLVEAYGLDRTAGWVFWRNSFEWPKEEPEKIRSIDLTIRKEPVDLPGPHFWTGPEAAGKEVELIHPVTGKVHRLTVLGQELSVLPLQSFPSELEMEHFPDHFTMMHYQVEPEISRDELLISDCAQSDQPVRRTDVPAVCSVSVIGGADGPTSIFLLGKAAGDTEHPEKRSVNSALHYEPTENIEWRVTFRVNENRETNIHIQVPEK